MKVFIYLNGNFILQRIILILLAVSAYVILRRLLLYVKNGKRILIIITITMLISVMTMTNLLMNPLLIYLNLILTAYMPALHQQETMLWKLTANQIPASLFVIVVILLSLRKEIKKSTLLKIFFFIVPTIKTAIIFFRSYFSLLSFLFLDYLVWILALPVGITLSEAE